MLTTSPPFLTLPSTIAKMAPPTVSATTSSNGRLASSALTSRATTLDAPSVTASARCCSLTPAITRAPRALAAYTAARPAAPTAPVTKTVCVP